VTAELRRAVISEGACGCAPGMAGWPNRCGGGQTDRGDRIRGTTASRTRAGDRRAGRRSCPRLRIPRSVRGAVAGQAGCDAGRKAGGAWLGRGPVRRSRARTFPRSSWTGWRHAPRSLQMPAVPRGCFC